ncbi:MAG: hypothetical protein WA771_10855 [Chthoniobacterales bacterium]
MIYSFPLVAVGIVVGLLLIGTHAFALTAPDVVRPRLLTFPRSRVVGTILLAIAALWAFWLVCTMDLGEFARLRRLLILAVPVGAVLTWYFVDEFLAVRSLGILALLAAGPLLEAAFLQEPLSRLFLVALAYLWIFSGLFLVGMPFLLRDAIAYLVPREKLYRRASWAGIAYGGLILLYAIIFWH